MIYKKDDIILRPFIDLDEGSNYMNWFDNPEIVNLTSHGVIPKTDDEFFEYIKNNGNGYIVYKIAIKDPENYGKKIHIGNIALQQINWINRSAELAIIIGEKDYHEKGIATFAVKCMLYHAFLKMGLNRVWSGTSERNIGMQKVFEKCGFEKEGVFKEAKFLNGEFTDIWEYAILKNDFDLGKECLYDD